jgi:hypothetical protein
MPSSLAKAMHSRIAGSEIPGKVAMEQPIKIPLAFLAMAAASASSGYVHLVLLELTVAMARNAGLTSANGGAIHFGSCNFGEGCLTSLSGLICLISSSKLLIKQ